MRCHIKVKMCAVIRILLISVLQNANFFAFASSVTTFPGDDQEIYDFIVVGAGTAGCVVAARLSENGKHTVLLLERGGYPHPNLDIPARMYSQRTPEFVQRYDTAPQKNVARQSGGIIRFSTGRVLGGGSAVNGMQFNRGHPLDYDNWANLTGDPSWSYANMLSYFKRIENYHGEFPLTNQHGVDGPIFISRAKYAPGLDHWLNAGKELGYPLTDPNGPQEESFTPLEFSQRFGRRVSSYAGYIRPVINTRSNLKLVTSASVSRILFTRDLPNIRASGVSYHVTSSPQHSSTLISARARKEVIICAGVIGSPTILLRSGVGPKETLEPAGVPLVKELPVGENLHDHVGVRMDFFISNTSVVFDPERDLNAETWKHYNEFGDGPYSSPYGQHAQAFLRSSQVPVSMPWPDLQIVQFFSRGLQSFSNQTDYTDLRQGETPVYCLATLTRPQSRGRITLNNTDIEKDPVVDFKFSEDSRDERALVDAIKSTLTIFERTATYGKIGARYNPSPWPACGHIPFRSEEYWRCLIREKGSSALHAAGSCKMGRVGHPGTVVDTKLSVVGVDGLRVVDASVMPTVVNSNTQAAVYAIAEKASSTILEPWENF